MKIIHLCANNTWGGGEQYVCDLVSQLAKEQWCDTIVVCRDIPIVYDRFAEQGIPVVKLGISGYTDLLSMLALSEMIDNYGDCVIHAHDFKRAFIALVARKLSGNHRCKVIMTRHLVRCGKKGFFENFVYKHIDKLVFVSNLAKREFLSSSPAIDVGKCCVILSGVKERPCDNSCLRERWDILPDDFVLMYHGRIVPEKGIDTIAETLIKLKGVFPWKMVFIGDDTSYYALSVKRNLKAAGVDRQVFWAGYQSDIEKWIGGATCGVLPTTVREAFGLSVVEYMMAGKCVITTDNGAQTEYIKDGINGVLIPCSSPDVLAEKIVELYNSKKYIELGIKARKYYENYLNYDIFFDKLSELYKGLFLNFPQF